MVEKLTMAQLQGYGKQRVVAGVPLCGSRPEAIVLKDLQELAKHQYFKTRWLFYVSRLNNDHQLLIN